MGEDGFFCFFKNVGEVYMNCLVLMILCLMSVSDLDGLVILMVRLKFFIIGLMKLLFKISWMWILGYFSMKLVSVGFRCMVLKFIGVLIFSFFWGLF